MTRDVILALNDEGWPVENGDLGITNSSIILKSTGENITLDEIPYSHFALEQKYKLGTIEFQISRIIEPCNNLGALEYVGMANRRDFINTLTGRRGWYARVLKAGTIKAGDALYQI
jgi:MOSC domain-containing protein YiiM